MVTMIFNPERLPRTTTRDEWRVIWRRKRDLEKKCRAMMDEHAKNLREAGPIPLDIRRALADKIINPPAVIYPDPKFDWRN